MDLINYEGNLHEEFGRHGQGTEIFYRKPGVETYLGQFCYDTYHGEAEYKSKDLFSPWTFEGRFFCNQMEGYGTKSHADSSFFEGLYKNNTQFGPGILTYSSGKQDVGLWMGSLLVRLSTGIVTIDRLAKNPKDSAKLLRFKKIIGVTEEKIDVAEEVMVELNAPEELLNCSDELYDKMCHQTNSYLFNLRTKKFFFERSFVPVNDEIIAVSVISLMSEDKAPEEVIYSKPHFDFTSTTDVRHTIDSTSSKKSLKHSQSRETMQSLTEPEPSYIIAWNNTPLLMLLLKHSYQNQHLEATIHIDVMSILKGKRQKFCNPGRQEKMSLALLRAAVRGEKHQVAKLISQGVNIDVMDNKGVTPLLAASASDGHEVIRLLIRCQCNMNVVNDEGFSAVTHTLTRLMALKLGLRHWGKAFLKSSWLDNDLGANVKKWREKKSVKDSMSLTHILDKRVASLMSATSNSSMTVLSNYVFDLSTDCNTLKQMNHYGKVPKNERGKLKKKMKDMETTIELLVEGGTNLTVSRVPVPALLMAALAGSTLVVKHLLAGGEDPDLTIPDHDGHLTVLHAIALFLPDEAFPEIVKLLLSYCADPHKRAAYEFDEKAIQFLMKNDLIKNFPMEGMNPLHALCLRTDVDRLYGREILKEVCNILDEVTRSTEWYLGHNALTLAVARCNPWLAETLLSNDADANCLVHPCHGCPLTVLIKYKSFNYDDAIKMLKLLSRFGANPLCFTDIDSSMSDANVMNYVQHKLQQQKKHLTDDDVKKDKRLLAEQKQRVSQMAHLVEDYENLAREKVDAYIKGYLVRQVVGEMERLTTLDSGNWVLKQAKHWLTPDEFFNLLTTYLHYNIIQLEFQDARSILVVLNDWKKEIKHHRNVSVTNIFFDERDGEEVVRLSLKSEGSYEQRLMATLHQVKKKGSVVEEVAINYNLYPELHLEEWFYKVCYVCGIRSPALIPCKMCGLIYICSSQCFLASKKNPKGIHRCKGDHTFLAPEKRAVSKFYSKLLMTSGIKYGMNNSSLLKKNTLLNKLRLKRLQDLRNRLKKKSPCNLGQCQTVKEKGLCSCGKTCYTPPWCLELFTKASKTGLDVENFFPYILLQNQVALYRAHHSRFQNENYSWN